MMHGDRGPAPFGSDVNPLCDIDGVIDLDAEVRIGALDLRMTEQDPLHFGSVLDLQLLVRPTPGLSIAGQRFKNSYARRESCDAP